MFRTVLLKSARSAASQAVRRAGPITRPASAIPTFQYAPSVFNAARCYSAAAGLAKPEVEGRIVDLLKNFDKVSAPELGVLPVKLLFVANQFFKVTDPSKLTPTSHFNNDLGLDSLDTVEVVMAIEEEFSIEIPDKDADAIHSVDKAVEYILAQPDAH
ncbi:NADH dehydrogenase 1 alpha/beta subcomplex 1 [Pseudogymnoascus sp. WSF 3629]|nr:NADH dehydrogenase 1 alpha/beta subcomplex 1 [Pseudogymnoascus sp. WSF 3629]